jgi:Nuclear fragile X mental retardation-interacting protein 1 (NUFIP1)
MMDRHLIYPPGWEKRRKKPDWDADPSLKGSATVLRISMYTIQTYIYRKPVPIQGTSIILDSPEILDAWIAERKKRFPTSSRIEDKKRKLEDAVARGQLDITGATLRSNKRQKCDHGSHHKMRNGKIGKDQTRMTDTGWGGRIRAAPIAPTRAIATIEASHSNSSSDDDTDREPELLSSKIQDPSEIPVVQDVESKGLKTLAPPRSVVGHHRSSVLQPKNPARNPFASRPTLLRNVSHSALSFAPSDSFAF